MEMRGRTILIFLLLGLFAFFIPITASAQPIAAYSIKNGSMYIQVGKDVKPAQLDSFIKQYELDDLDLSTFIKTNKEDSLRKLGWKVEINNESFFVISKAFEPFGDRNNVANIKNDINHALDRILFEKKPVPLFPATDNSIVFGVNKFRNKVPFTVKDSVVTFSLRGSKNARRVMLAGSFNDWNPEALPMKSTDSGWSAEVKLGPGKYWYKFIIDGNWAVDTDNQLKENDGLGNINSVFYRTNTAFTLNAFRDAKKVFLSGSFNNWKPNELAMNKTATGWELPLYLAEGTHTYKFVVDGRWYHDENNPEKLPDGTGGFNSVIRFGNPYLFQLKGFETAKEVFLTGSFNSWKGDELAMNRTSTGWELPYTLGAGNYEYKFVIDGKWITDPGNSLSSSSSGNSYLVIKPNYTFRLRGFKDAKQVFLAGDFNRWDPKAYAMSKEGDDWIFPVHLSVGKHLYKVVVDGKWMNDPGNPLWEQNEYGTGNSIVWIGR